MSNPLFSLATHHEHLAFVALAGGLPPRPGFDPAGPAYLAFHAEANAMTGRLLVSIASEVALVGAAAGAAGGFPPDWRTHLERAIERAVERGGWRKTDA